MSRETATGEVILPAVLVDGTGANLDNGIGGISTTSAVFTSQFAYDGSGNIQYIGIAMPGSSVASAVWYIRQLTYDVNNNLTGILNANGSKAFNQIWNNRASLSYS